MTYEGDPGDESDAPPTKLTRRQVRRRLVEVTKAICDRNRELGEDVERLTMENARLRAALEGVRPVLYHHELCLVEPSECGVAEQQQAIDAALAGQPGPGDAGAREGGDDATAV